MSLVRGVQRLALRLGVAAATTRGRLPLPPSCLAALRARFSSAAAYPTAAARSQRSCFARGSATMGLCGGINDAPGREMDPEAIELAQFAVAEHNRNKDAALEFVRLVRVRHQLVAGDMYYFTVEAREVDGGGTGVGANKLYEAKVWLRPWENFKGLDAFVPVANADEGETKV